MKLKILKLFTFFICCNLLIVHGQNKKSENSVMSDAYWKHWNSEVQAKIDNDIEKNRKADAVLNLEGLPAGTAIKVEQISHDFIFGAHIFNYNQLGTSERNQKYKDLYGTLFNSATIAFYWKALEMQPNRLRFKEEYWDTEEYWNQVATPELEPHWRRPATDPVVEFCEDKGIRMHGHTIIWSNRMWHHPEWIFEQFCPEDEKIKLSTLSKDELYKLTPEQIHDFVPTFFKRMNDLFKKHIVDLAQYYGDRIHSWDIVNESRTDFDKKRIFPGDEIRKGRHGLMPGDYTFKSFKTANEVFPKNVLFNINDNVRWEDDKYEAYTNQIKDLIVRGSRIDIMGSQMHFFEPQQCLDIADGLPIATPDKIWEKMEKLSSVGLPIHLSEITITSPGHDERGHEIQSVIARNLYRLWFSVEKVMGITWWNVVDGCGAPGETTISGLFTRNMEPKPSFFALNNLINNEWKTRTTVVVDENGQVKFRGFKGNYRLSWKNSAGEEQVAEFYLKNDGDGL
ncbi:endo-1,4-beta-xylanase [Aurantibacter sp.]|uniref:endo-1,4-beta-xylanase n=1 Tax=Aurantibacter sp. TaxID=2807103 RepID=UPI0032635D85